MMNNTYTTNATSSIPTIVSVADSTHYLVGTYDDASNFVAINSTSSIDSFTSLFQAKQFLRNHHVESAHIEYHTAYDEMCGTQTCGLCKETVKL